MKKWIFLFVCTLGTLAGWAQTVQLQGRVTDKSTGQPLAGVTVRLQNSNTGAVSDAQGNFSLEVPKAAQYHLVFSYVGYQTQTIAATPGSRLQVQMIPSQQLLNQVVVVGYGTVNRRDLTASVSSVTAEQLKDVPINSAAEALAGRLAGVQVTGSEGSPDAQVMIRVRGGGSITQDNSPLYVVDGVIMDNALSTLSPQDIESIDVLKDASATAIYGARGANGVVIITTKSGKAGRTTVSYNGFVGVQKLEKELKVFDPYDYVLYQYEWAQGSQQNLNNFYKTFGLWSDIAQYKQAPFVDWQDQVFGRPALMQTHNVDINGGSEKTQVSLSLTDNETQAIMEGSDFNRKLVNFRLNHQATNYLKVGFNVRFDNQTIDGAGTSNPGSSATNFLRQAIRYPPFLSPGTSLDYYDASLADNTNANGLYLVNPLLLIKAQYKRQYRTVLGLSGYADLTITKFLSFRTTMGYTYDLQNTNQYDDSLSYNSRLNGNAMPIATISNNNYLSFDNSNVFTFSNNKLKGSFHQHNHIQLIVGQETYETRNKSLGIVQKYFPNGTSPQKALGNLSLASPPIGFQEPSPTSSEDIQRILSFFSRVMYNYKDKYLATASIRADGSSVFAPGRQWGYFPAASLAWRISQEPFMQGLQPVISDMKLRLSYGEAGNNRISSFLFLTQFNTNGNYYGLQDQLATAYGPVALANPYLKWESTLSRDIGLDVSLFNSRVQLSADYYRNKTKDLLVNVRIPQTSGYLTQIQNVGSTSNNGFELQLNTYLIETKDFSWNASFNISFNQNKVLSLGNQTFFTVNSGWAGSNNPDDYIVQVGKPVGSMFGFVNDGYYTLDDFNYDKTTGTYTLKPGVVDNSSITGTAPQPGTIKFKDLNGDGKITTGYAQLGAGDETIIGNANPKFFGGLNQQFVYKGFDLSIFVNFQYGNKVFNANKLEFASGYTPYANLLAIMKDRWRIVDDQGNLVTDPDQLAALNAHAKIWQPVKSAYAAFAPQSWAVEDGSFLRINNITLGYTLPERLTKRFLVQKLRAYVTLNNLAVVTPYSGYDPEVNTRRGTPMTPGVDFSAYPRSKAYIFGLNVTF
ncbi:SusC/RagA family TonB-linked outer membrane protein [Thermoflavifilum thermophilum]|uniref:TonB-linked outer membrane protein, SusC/RagA family n=1 Tax=Thermoflavifilum thermophilum TaxID=1393122 RepID=A0A1I7N7W2_9BACT|nr:TonB-dependent receptor [Thermoflavifilum thermophilum]SFV30745.1 TonB-linked outer membrane protein, SusC/RagA family [Thermoflavifilum thermophilum]